MNNDYLLGREKVSKALLTLGIPATVAMIVNAVHNIIDTIFIGRYVGVAGIGATSAFLPVMMIVMALATMMGIGAGSLASRQLGRKDREGVNRTMGTLTVFTVLVSAALSITGFLFTSQIMELFGAKGAILSPAVEYAETMIYGVFIFPFCVAANNIIRAEGNAKYAMFSMLSGILSNIVLDYILIVRFDMGMAGAGIATSLANFISFGYILWYFAVKSSISLRPHNFIPDIPILKEILAVGFSAFAVQISAGMVTIVLNHMLFLYGGETALSVHGVVFKLIVFFMMPLHGLVQGMQPIVGYSRGAGDHARVKKAVMTTLLYAVAFSTLSSMTAILFPEYIIRLFTDDAALISSGRSAVRTVLLAAPLVGIYITGMTFFQSIGDARMSLIISILRQPLIFLPTLMLLPGILGFGIHGIWMTFPVSDVLATLITLACIMKMFNKPQISAENATARTAAD